MEPAKSILISNATMEAGSTSAFGVSGILISSGWALTHGSILQFAVSSVPKIREFFDNSSSLDDLTLLPDELSKSLTFQVHYVEKSSDQAKVKVVEKTGAVVAAWRCSLLRETLENQFFTWNFEKLGNFDRTLLSVFLLMEIDDEQPRENKREAKTTKERARRSLEECISKHLIWKNLRRGITVEVESTPFGNPAFLENVSRGIISNIVGIRKCVIMTDANVVPGCEGAPLFIVDKSGKRRLCGMIIAPMSWCRGERVDYTFATNLWPCLQKILNFSSKDQIPRLEPFSKTILEQDLLSDRVDKHVVVVKCGTGWGTGVIVDVATGTILTCSHVVREAPESRVKVVFRRNDDEEDEGSDSATWARLIFRTHVGKPYDVAVLRVDPQEVDPSLRPLPIADGRAVRGETVLTAGFPFFSANLPTISRGNISRSTDCILQTTCCLQSGASGGPVVRFSTGEMLGLIVSNAVTASDAALYPRFNMAVPAIVFKGPLAEYIATNDSACLESLSTQDPMAMEAWNFDLTPRSKL